MNNKFVQLIDASFRPIFQPYYRRHGRTDLPMDGPTDIPSFRESFITQPTVTVKKILHFLHRTRPFTRYTPLLEDRKNWVRTDRRTDRPSDERTHPHVESLHRD